MKLIGNRLREARANRAITQPDLAKIIGKSKQLVSAWENGTAEMTVTSVGKLTRVLGVDATWLILGNEAGRTRDGNLQVGQTVPLLTSEQILAFADGQLTLRTIARKFHTFFDCSTDSFGWIVPDSAMRSTVDEGDCIVLDPRRKAVPGSHVLVVVFAQNGEGLKKPIPMLRRIRYLDRVGRAPYSLEASNLDWPPARVASDADASILGSMCIQFGRRSQ